SATDQGPHRRLPPGRRPRPTALRGDLQRLPAAGGRAVPVDWRPSEVRCPPQGRRAGRYESKQVGRAGGRPDRPGPTPRTARDICYAPVFLVPVFLGFVPVFLGFSVLSRFFCPDVNSSVYP